MFHILSETLSEETAQCPSVLPLFDLQSLEVSFLFVIVGHYFYFPLI